MHRITLPGRIRRAALALTTSLLASLLACGPASSDGELDDSEENGFDENVETSLSDDLGNIPSDSGAFEDDQETGEVASAATVARAYYLSPTGNDANPGTKDKPWRTLDRLQAAQTSIKAGDTVYFRGGTYAVRDSNRSYYSFRAKGTSKAPITYRNYPGEKPILVYDRTTADNATGSGTFIFMSGNFSVYDGLTIRQSEASRLQGMKGTTIVRGRTKTALATWGSNVVVRNSTIENFAGLGIYYHGTNLLVENNTVVGTGSHAFYIAGKDGVYRGNVTDGARGYSNQQGIQIQYKSSVGNKIYGNTLKNGRASGVVFSGAVSNNEVFDNTIVNGGSGAPWGTALSFWCEDGPIGVGNKFYRNKVVGKSSSAMISNASCKNKDTGFLGRKVDIRDNVFCASPAVRVGLTTTNVHDNTFHNASGALPPDNRLATQSPCD